MRVTSRCWWCGCFKARLPDWKWSNRVREETKYELSLLSTSDRCLSSTWHREELIRSNPSGRMTAWDQKIVRRFWIKNSICLWVYLCLCVLVSGVAGNGCYQRWIELPTSLLFVQKNYEWGHNFNVLAFTGKILVYKYNYCRHGSCRPILLLMIYSQSGYSISQSTIQIISHHFVHYTFALVDTPTRVQVSFLKSNVTPLCRFNSTLNFK